MAQQLHFAYSSQVIGVGILSSSVYHCANGSIAKAVMYCMQDPRYINLTEIQASISKFETENLIDPVKNL